MSLLMSKKLKYFIVAYETQCINSAAEQLCVTRSPLARALYELEDKAGGKLFTRKYNQLYPTNLALLLYQKTKPIYDLLCGIENEFMISPYISKIELLCDFSVPYIVYQHLCSKLKNISPLIECRRVIVSNCEMQSLISNPMVVLFSFRKITVPDNFTCHEFKSESLCLILPENISNADILDFEIMKDITLYIKKDLISAEVKGFVFSVVKKFMPYTNIKEIECDTVSLLFYASTGEGMILLPESLVAYLSPPRTRTLKIPDIRLQSGLYVNNRNKNTSVIQKITDILAQLME
ncbi:LysR family transcriptional regulator [Enterobacter sp. 22452]|uniref:LysR family transcriptional regulator n=1 Tax=Enterobacter TaxID=547 RepID=UPI003F8594B0